jgi:thioredoxin reductase (NADPH)
MEDCVIIGGGPAGLATAIYLARFRVTCAVLDGGTSRAARIPRCRNFPGYVDGIPGAELLARMRQQLARYAIVPLSAKASGIVSSNGMLKVETEAGSLTSRTVVLATGSEDVRPPFSDTAQHDAALQAGLLHYCPVCDGYEVKGKHVAVLGTGAHGVREALFIRSFTNDVSLVNPSGPHVLPDEQKRTLQERRVEMIDGPIGLLRIESGALGFEAGGRTHLFDAAYAALGCQQHTKLAEMLGADITEEGIRVDAHMRTNVPGVYAAGDVVAGLNQITTAVGNAAVAATAIRNALRG